MLGISANYSRQLEFRNNPAWGKTRAGWSYFDVFCTSLIFNFPGGIAPGKSFKGQAIEVDIHVSFRQNINCIKVIININFILKSNTQSHSFVHKSAPIHAQWSIVIGQYCASPPPPPSSQTTQGQCTHYWNITSDLEWTGLSLYHFVVCCFFTLCKSFCMISSPPLVLTYNGIRIFSVFLVFIDYINSIN